MTYKIKAGIVDDEKHGRDYIALLLTNEFPEISIAFTASGMQDALLQLETVSPDILLLDIELGDGSAFDLLAKTNTKGAQLIFITAYEHYALKAIKNDAIDFVLKPVEVEEFVTAIKKAIGNIEKNRVIAKEASPLKINLPIRNGFKSVAIADIVRCEADSNYTWIHLVNKSKTMVSKTLQEFELLLVGTTFFRIHHKHLINLDHFVEYRKGPGGEVLLSDGSIVEVSTRRKSDFMDVIKKRND